MEYSSTLRASAFRVFLSIIVFLLFYCALIVIGVGLFVGAFLGSEWIFDEGWTLAKGHLKATIFLGVALVAMWAAAFMLGFYLVKPLFGFKKEESYRGEEVTRQAAPELFAVIDELVAQVGCRRPRHVYLTTDVNACVFYDTNFWSIFFPVEKNLQIGLGLCSGTNVDELRSVLAHEFGHFAQKSMKFGSCVYELNHIIYDLVYTEDAYDAWLEKWAQSRLPYWGYFGRLTRWFTRQVQAANRAAYRMVQRHYLALSRQMEFDADAVAIHAVGSAAFISSANKISILVDHQRLYERFLAHFALEEKKTVTDFWQGYESIERELEENDDTILTPAALLVQNNRFLFADRSRVSVKNLWASHPDTSDRIAQAVRLEVPSKKPSFAPSWSLIPAASRAQVGALELHGLLARLDVKAAAVDSAQFRRWVDQEMERYFIPLLLRPFFDRDILSFPVEEIPAAAIHAPSPFQEKNAEQLLELEAARSDLALLEAIAAGDTEVAEFRYQGKLYRNAREPLAVQRAYVGALMEVGRVGDQSVFSWLLTHAAPNTDVKALYQTLFYAEDYEQLLPELLGARDALVEALPDDEAAVDDRGQEKLDALFASCAECLLQALGRISAASLDLIVKPEYVAHLQAVKASLEGGVGSCNEGALQVLLPVIDNLEHIHEQLRCTARNEIVDAAKKALQAA